MTVERTLPALASAFFVALRDDQHERAKAILDECPDIATFSVHTAAAVGDVRALHAFLAADDGAATRPSQPDGIEPIIFAATGHLKSLLGVSESARADVVRLLLDAGANPNTFVQLPHDHRARIPALYFACVSDNVPAARVLLERGATVNDGESVYHAAEHDHRECLALLLAHGADLSIAHAEWGNTPLHFLATYGERHERIDVVTRGMQWLLEHGADPDVPSQVQSRDGSADNGPDANPASDGEVPLHRLAAGRGVSAARLFIEHGATVDAPRTDGRTPYVLAVRAGNTAVAEYLASNGADVSRLGTIDRFIGACSAADERTARQIEAEHPTIVASLTLDDRRALHTAVFNNRVESVQLMLSLGWPLDDESEWQGTALHWAAWHGYPRLVDALIRAGAPVNRRDSLYGSSPIAWAAHGSQHARNGNEQDYAEIVRRLLDAGSTRAESFNQWGEAPESMSSAAVAELLQQRGFAP